MTGEETGGGGALLEEAETQSNAGRLGRAWQWGRQTSQSHQFSKKDVQVLTRQPQGRKAERTGCVKEEMRIAYQQEPEDNTS